MSLIPKTELVLLNAVSAARRYRFVRASSNERMRIGERERLGVARELQRDERQFLRPGVHIAARHAHLVAFGAKPLIVSQPDIDQFRIAGRHGSQFGE